MLLINIHRSQLVPSKNAGFTLTELVAVIVILGVLALTSLPKFVNVNTDGRIASLETVKGSLYPSYLKMLDFSVR